MCQQLQSCCPQDRVDLLSNAYYVEPATAISALRKFNGDPDAAGNFIASVRNDEVQSAKKRKRQHRLGKCSNNIDFVNLDLVQKLNDLLGYSDINVQDDGQADYSTSMMITISLLRLTDNDIEKSFSLYNEIGAQEVLQRAQQVSLWSLRSSGSSIVGRLKVLIVLSLHSKTNNTFYSSSTETLDFSALIKNELNTM
jgi:hypothetical protein